MKPLEKQQFTQDLILINKRLPVWYEITYVVDKVFYVFPLSLLDSVPYDLTDISYSFIKMNSWFSTVKNKKDKSLRFILD